MFFMSDIDFEGAKGILLGKIKGGIIRLVEKKGGLIRVFL